MIGDYVAALVFENGSALCRAGLAGEYSPRATFPSIVGKEHLHCDDSLTKEKGFYVGNEAQSKRNILSLRYPIENGIIKNWDDMETIWHHTFYNELRMSPEEHAVLIAKASLSPGDYTEKIAEIFFETFNCPAIYIPDQSVLSLNMTGRTSGIVLDTGASSTRIIPVDEGKVLDDAIKCLDVGGNDLTEYLTTLINTTRRDSLEANVPQEIVPGIKEKCCYIALDFQEEMEIAMHNPLLEKSYIFPNGEVCKLSHERFRCPECIFQPYLIGKNNEGVHHNIFNSIMNCDEDIREELFANIVLSGGTSMFPGISHRIHREITSLAPLHTKIKIIASPSRNYLSWLGGSILASLPTFDTWVTKNEYEENGYHRAELR